MSKAGIYLYNGILAYSINLDKKLKRRKGAIIIEEYEGTETGSELESILQKMLDKHNNITKEEKSDSKDLPLTYHWVNINNRYTRHSIRNDFKEDGWLQYQVVDDKLFFDETPPFKIGDKINGKIITEINNKELATK